MKKLVGLAIEGAKVLDLCVEGDKLLEAGTGAVYNKAVKGVKVSKGASLLSFSRAPAHGSTFHRSHAHARAHVLPRSVRRSVLDGLLTSLRPPRTQKWTSRHLPPGIAFPTCVSVNNTVAHFSPLESDPSSGQTLAKGDVVKLHLGAHIDGYAAVSAETLVVGASAADPVTGRKADVIQAAWHAAEVVQRLVKVGNKNWTITEAVGKIAAAFDCKPVEGASHSFTFYSRLETSEHKTALRMVGMLSCQQSQNVIDGKKRIILNPVCPLIIRGCAPVDVRAV